VRRNQLVIWSMVLVVAFLVGVSGAPGHVIAAAAGWLTSSGHVQLVGPVGEAVREAL
jgi:hypothetical protein